MKKGFAILLAALLLAALAPAALAARAPETLEGFVTELAEGGFLMEDTRLGEVFLNTDDTTVWDGALADGAVAVGQYVFVQYDGRLTRSIPPQAHADKVGCYVLTGVAAELTEDGVLLADDPIFGDVLVRLGSLRAHVYAGVPLTVYYNGVMAMSLPGQVNASAVLVPMLEGAAGQKDEQGFTLTADDGATYRVEWDEGTVFDLLTADDEAPEGLTDEAGETDVDAEASATPDKADGEADKTDKTDKADKADNVDAEASATPDTADGADAEASATPATDKALSPDCLSDGDRVRVYFSGEYLNDEGDAVLALEVLVLQK